jgi:rod shape-determining protein MreC
MVISITVIAVDLLGLGPIDFVRDGVNGALSPVRGVGNAIFGNDDSDEVAALEERVTELEGAEIERDNYLAELRRIQETLGLEVPDDITAVPATITSQAVGNFDPTVEIDIGANDGVEVNMPVTAGGALVGVVDSVTFRTARISLISNPNVSVGVRHAAPDNEVGIAHGQGDGQPLVIGSGFDAAVRVGDGDGFVTDGPAGSNFPPGLVVGTAVRVTAGDNPLEQLVYIEPTADLESLSQVAVLLFTPSEAGPGDEGGEAG